VLFLELGLCPRITNRLPIHCSLSIESPTATTAGKVPFYPQSKASHRLHYQQKYLAKASLRGGIVGVAKRTNGYRIDVRSCNPRKPISIVLER
jgi:hypothetical protein